MALSAEWHGHLRMVQQTNYTIPSRIPYSTQTTVSGIQVAAMPNKFISTYPNTALGSQTLRALNLCMLTCMHEQPLQFVAWVAALFGTIFVPLNDTLIVQGHGLECVLLLALIATCHLQKGSTAAVCRTCLYILATACGWSSFERGPTRGPYFSEPPV